ncbi:MAG TPA: hypothetical protein VMU77_07560 [Acidimicrobiales bacterium]|nr:hypothetical protein [Acidimicrobiales bacterium]
MDIEEFYQEDPRRRESEELAYGLNWASEQDKSHLWDLFWVRDTGELYLMSKDAPPKWLPLIAGLRHPRHHLVKTGEAQRNPGGQGHSGDGGTSDQADDEYAELGVEIVARISTREEVEQALNGWKEQVSSPDGIGWLRQRLASR